MEKNDSNKQIFRKTLIVGFSLLAFFLLTAIGSSLLGHYLDSYYKIEPMGTLGTMVVGYIISITFAFVLVIKKKAFSTHSQ